jgi:serine/threonine protein phosphatase 1
MFHRIFTRPRKRIDRARVDKDLVVYAVGDVHGAADSLRRLHARIAADAAGRRATRRVLVHLGDYVDRGAGAAAVLDRLADIDMPGFEVVNLQGNHDAWFLRFLEDPHAGPDWLANGGEATLLSYGVSPRTDLPGAERMEAIRRKLRERVPHRHRLLLQAAPLYHREGDYLFVHAGVKPRVAVESQSAADLLWIRDEFLACQDDHGYVVVHGHTVVEEPEIHHNRIAVDTGAYATGRLSALVLQGAERSFLTA